MSDVDIIGYEAHADHRLWVIHEQDTGHFLVLKVTLDGDITDGWTPAHSPRLLRALAHRRKVSSPIFLGYEAGKFNTFFYRRANGEPFIKGVGSSDFDGQNPDKCGSD